MKFRKILIPIIACFVFFEVYSNNPQDQKKTIQQKTEKPDQSSGDQLYIKYCLTCHQPDGNGVRGMYPPLAGNQKITGPTSDLITIVLFGLEGPIEVNGREYNQVMPAQGYLEDKQIADVLTYIRRSWGNKATPVKSQEVAKIRKAGKPK